MTQELKLAPSRLIGIDRLLLHQRRSPKHHQAVGCSLLSPNSSFDTANSVDCILLEEASHPYIYIHTIVYSIYSI